MYLSVKKVKPLNEYNLELTFENNEIKIFDEEKKEERELRKQQTLGVSKLELYATLLHIQNVMRQFF